MIEIHGGRFIRDGKPHQILSGAIHYPRVPRAYWRDRLRKARAMGMNTVETYVFWNLHEPQPGRFQFGGDLDVAAFVRLAQAEGLDVLLRPGPYVCAEWDAGGFPAWLFANPSLRVRTTDPRFLAAAERYLVRVGKELRPLLAAHGGPIVAVQVENEYGSFGSDRAYMEAICALFRRAGFGDAILYTADGPSQTPNGSLPGLFSVVNFAPGEAEGAFAQLVRLRPGQPLMSGEYWAGWFDQWGGAHAHTNAQGQANDLDWMLAHGCSVNLYMFHGGTSFGFMNGANFQGGPDDHYSPQTTSYDYDAALDEAGRPTPKFFLFRDVIRRRTGEIPPALPAPLPIATLPEVALTESAALWDNLPAPITASRPQPMESVGQAYGYILYRTELTGPLTGDLVLDDLRDYTAVYVNQKRIGTLDRRLKQRTLSVTIPSGNVTLDLLVENSGRVNYGPYLPDGRSGITNAVSIGGRELFGWRMYQLPMESPRGIRAWRPGGRSGPAFHRGVFMLTNTADTFLDTRALGKGFVWINGRNLGRVWSIGPQRSLYVPAPWLRRGINEVVVFDYEDLDRPMLRGVTDPIWSTPTS